ncbi:hydrolase, alpha/beta fold family protein [Polaribacter irgensii 23-P]|uniref:Hydrolase, alpha/beta fold family protein n=1 Tax=Polaribacter irgensii 23-P TaxID=313594 RepID=A4BXG4_9FLAO|nr:alpha/beta hydrolase [Polaribacter irgensii]EAR13655.1 hydrolase, alpha/beta fold family protein [Polaribacter irgensii 23-P]
MQKSITFKNANIFFSDQGKGTAIILLHGFLENSTMWKHIIPIISQRNRVIAIDLLGHGKTDCLGYVHSMNLFAEPIEAVLKHLQIRKYVLIGHSLGGYVALAFAEKYPQKIKGLCLMNATSNADDDERKALRLRANKMIPNNFLNIIRMSFTNLFSAQNKILFREALEEALTEALKTPLQGYIAAQEGMRIRPNRNHVLKGNSFRKLLIISEKDPVLDFKTALLEAKETDSKFIIFPDGHMSHIENSAILVETLKSFIRTC